MITIVPSNLPRRSHILMVPGAGGTEFAQKLPLRPLLANAPQGPGRFRTVFRVFLLLLSIPTPLSREGHLGYRVLGRCPEPADGGRAHRDWRRSGSSLPRKSWKCHAQRRSPREAATANVEPPRPACQ